MERCYIFCSKWQINLFCHINELSHLLYCNSVEFHNLISIVIINWIYAHKNLQVCFEHWLRCRVGLHKSKSKYFILCYEIQGEKNRMNISPTIQFWRELMICSVRLHCPSIRFTVSPDSTNTLCFWTQKVFFLACCLPCI